MKLKPYEVVDEDVAAILRTKTPGERLAMVFDLYDLARTLVESGVRRDEPDWDDDQVRKEVVRRMASGSL